MKKLFSSILFFAAITSFAQSPIINLEDDDDYKIPGAYYRDTNNRFNAYEGTYVLATSTIYWKIVLQKKIMQYDNTRYFDLIIGGYQYKVNGVELINTLSDVNAQYSNPLLHSISCNYFIGHWASPPCSDCGLEELRIMGSIVEPITELAQTLTIRKILVNGQEAIKIHLLGSNVYYDVSGPEPPDGFLNAGEFILIKQP